MRNNVKVVAPAIVQGLGILPDGLFMALNAPFHDIVLKQKDESTINLLGKGKSIIDSDNLHKVIAAFCKNEDILKCEYEINITSKILPHYPFHHQASVAAGLLVALTTAYRKGHYPMELYEQYHHLFDNPVEKGAFYTAFSGGMVTGLPEDNLFQKVYTPNGLSMVIIESPGEITEINPTLSANVLLAFANTNFSKMDTLLGKYNAQHGLYQALRSNNGLGLLSINEHLVLAIFKNTMDSQEFINYLEGKHIESNIETEGILVM